MSVSSTAQKVNQSLLLNTSMVKSALGCTFTLMKDFDPYSCERKKTKKFRPKLLEISNRCAACGQLGNKVKIQAAHIMAIEEGGKTTLENLIPLCSNPFDKEEKTGCHKLFDTGCASKEEILKAKSLWQNGCIDINLRKKMKNRLRETNSQSIRCEKNYFLNFLQSCIKKREWKKALDFLKKKLKCANSKKKCFKIQLEMGTIHRRRAAKEGLDCAFAIFKNIGAEKIPNGVESRFYYERGYIYLLLGQHKNALKDFDLSRSLSNNTEEEVSAFWAWVHANITYFDQNVPWDIIHQELNKMEEKFNKLQGVDGKRLYTNGLFNRARIYLLQKNFNLAELANKQALEHWRNLHINNGWDKSFQPIILTLKGQLAVISNNQNDALGYFSRHLVERLGGRKNLSEGIRDVLFAIAACIDKSKYYFHVCRLINVAHQVRDGASWIFPYRA